MRQQRCICIWKSLNGNAHMRSLVRYVALEWNTVFRNWEIPSFDMWHQTWNLKFMKIWISIKSWEIAFFSRPTDKDLDKHRQSTGCCFFLYPSHLAAKYALFGWDYLLQTKEAAHEPFYSFQFEGSVNNMEQVKFVIFLNLWFQSILTPTWKMPFLSHV